jgi:excisionase family DNA binding protein
MNTERQPESLPNAETAQLARASATELSRLLAKLPASERARVQFDGHDLILPRQAVTLLRDVLAEMAQGNAVTIVPTHAQLTTQEAANLLNVSRPFLVALLEEGKIPFTKTGTHRRIRYQDLMVYKRHKDQESRDALDELTRQSQDLDLGY